MPKRTRESDSIDNNNKRRRLLVIDDSWTTGTDVHAYMINDPLLIWLKYNYQYFIKKHPELDLVQKGLYSLTDSSLDTISSTNIDSKTRTRKSRTPIQSSNYITRSKNKLSNQQGSREKDGKQIYNKQIQEDKDDNNYDFIKNQGNLFEQDILKFLQNYLGEDRIINIGGNKNNSKSEDKYLATLEAINSKIPVIYSGVVRSERDKLYGIPDLLIRSDWLPKLTDNIKSTTNEIHYVVVDIKYTTLPFRVDETHLLNKSWIPAYKAQLWIYNHCLTEMQNYDAGKAYILGRRWRVENEVNNFYFDKFAIIDYSNVDKHYNQTTLKAIDWVKICKSKDARNWDILNYPLVREELYPNMSNKHDQPWSELKKKICEKTHDITEMWMLGTKHRNNAHAKKVYSWKDKKCSLDKLGINPKSKTYNTINQMISINRQKRDKIRPKRIKTKIVKDWEWKKKKGLEIYVDFETSNACFFEMPDEPFGNDSQILFMIGVGYLDGNRWIYKHFTVDRLTNSEEIRICNNFIDWVAKLARKYKTTNVNLIHWSSFERIMWNKKVIEYELDEQLEYKWRDMIDLFKAEPIVINGCIGFGLKNIASKLYEYGFISTKWSSSCIDGLSAMIIIAKCNSRLGDNDKLSDLEPVRDIIEYNKIDVKILMDILTMLRKKF